MSFINDYKSYFTNLGLKPNEAKVYLACINLGPTTVSNISVLSGLQRTYVYDILEDLNIKGLVSYSKKDNITIFTALPLAKFEAIYRQKLARYRAILPQLEMFEKRGVNLPKVRYFQGLDGVKSAVMDTLSVGRGGEILLYFTGVNLWEKERTFAQEYIDKRVRMNIRIRAIAEDNPETRFWTNKDRDVLRTTRLVKPGLFPFTNEIDIYGDKVLFTSLTDEILAVAIESKSIATMQRAIFDLAWKGAAKEISN